MDEDELQCSVCFELPSGEVHQCHRGHFYCLSCWNDFDILPQRVCPQCRLPVPASNRSIVAEDAIRALPRERCDHCGESNTTLGHIRECSQRPAPRTPPMRAVNAGLQLTPTLRGAIEAERMQERVRELERQVSRWAYRAGQADVIIRERTEERDGYKRDVAALQQQMVLLESQKVLLQSQKAALEASLKKAGDSLAAEISKVRDQLKKEYGTKQREMLEKFVAMHEKNQLESKKRLAEKQREIECWVSLLRHSREDAASIKS